MKTYLSSLSVLLFVPFALLVSCSDQPQAEEQDASWDQLKSNAKSTYADVVELSKEKWNEVKSFSSDEWQEAGKSIVELKGKAVDSGKRAQPKIQKMLDEVDQLRRDAGEQLKAFQSASGEKAETSKQKLEATWKELQEKMDAVRDAVEDVD